VDATVNRLDIQQRGSGPDAAPRACREMAVETFTLQRPEARLPLVGEAGFQATLDRFSGGRDEDGAVFPHHAAVLVAEPHNRYDRDAVAVYVCDEGGDAEQVGYLSQHDAVAYGPLLRLVEPKVPMCLLVIHGGWDRGPADRRYHSASLNVGSPAEMAAEWLFDHHPPRAEHPWRGTKVAFIGHSSCTVGGIDLDRRAQAFLAEKAGCPTARGVGPSVRLCVVGHTETGTWPSEDDQAQLDYVDQRGIRRLGERAFWRALGYDLSGGASAT
jgi:hypothetical protein